MKNLFTGIFVGLGLVFIIVLLIGVYFFIADPYNLKPLIFGSPANLPTQQAGETDAAETNNNAVDGAKDTPAATGGFELSLGQRQALISFGIDPATVPSSISAEQEACFVSVLGEARVGEIKAGAVPSAFEFLKAKACI